MTTSRPEAPRSIWAVPGMTALAVVAFTGFSGYAALLPVAPLWAVRGGADSAGAGLVNFVLLGTTVATQFFVPALIRRLGWGHALALGMVLLGAPALLHVVSDALAPTLALSAVRGVGFGILTVAASAAAVLVVSAGRRGAAVGAYSLALSVPNVVLMPSGAWVAQAWGFGPVFVLSALPLLGIPACYVLGRHLPERATRGPGHVDVPDAPAGASTYRALVRPTLVLLAITLAGGALITFAPQLVATGWLAAAGLFSLGLLSAVTRWRVGALADRVGAARLVWPFVLVAVAGLAWVAWLVRTEVGGDRVVPWVLACALVGVAYGALQNLTMLRAFEAAGPRRVGAASAVWNAGFDAGTAVGAVLVGTVAVGAGFGVGMAITAVLCLLTLPLALGRRGGRTPRPGVRSP
ncbi:MFS transporter [Ornithinimicrobium cerasi]|uniref:Predicted arabinose efflux permease, MFS family n=1 Tax=Ornithinimicrobium cerasi TaxID=2248773 RepID=A0A285VU75_9MICO|nr:MFS transporter [Ornithinimicrobium cerasi]SOC56191.1 Predicted arabinose efflux permease, MFS family [Ornithinimicrobium cerasi]